MPNLFMYKKKSNSTNENEEFHEGTMIHKFLQKLKKKIENCGLWFWSRWNKSQTPNAIRMEILLVNNLLAQLASGLVGRVTE